MVCVCVCGGGGGGRGGGELKRVLLVVMSLANITHYLRSQLITV